MRKAGTDQPVDANTVFQLASVSKPVGATVVPRAAGERNARWEDPIVEYLPRFALEPRGESAVGFATVTFSRGTKSHAHSTKVEFLDDYGIGSFTGR